MSLVCLKIRVIIIIIAVVAIRRYAIAFEQLIKCNLGVGVSNMQMIRGKYIKTKIFIHRVGGEGGAGGGIEYAAVAELEQKYRGHKDAEADEERCKEGDRRAG